MAEPVRKQKVQGLAKGVPKESKPSAKFTRSDYELCINWLEKPGNLEKIEGAEGKTKVGGKVIVKSKAFKELAAYVNANQRKGSTLREVTGKSMKNRWHHFFVKYQRVKDESESTGWGITKEDEALGIKTIEEKLEYLCPLYHKVNALYAHSVKARNAGIGDYDSQIDQEGGDVVQFPWSVVPNSNPPEESTLQFDVAGHITSSFVTHIEQEGGEGENNTNREGASRSFNMENHDINGVNVEQTEAVPNLVENGGQRDNATSPREGTPIDLEEEDDLESPDRVSENVDGQTQGPTADNGPTSKGATNGKRDRSTSASDGENQGKYPAKKQIDNNRHSINVAFVDNLGSINEAKLKIAELEEKKHLYQIQVDGRKERAEKERFKWEMEWVELDREDRRQAAAMNAKEKLKQAALGAALGSQRTLQDIQAIYNLF